MLPPETLKIIQQASQRQANSAMGPMPTMSTNSLGQAMGGIQAQEQAMDIQPMANVSPPAGGGGLPMPGIPGMIDQGGRLIGGITRGLTVENKGDARAENSYMVDQSLQIDPVSYNAAGTHYTDFDFGVNSTMAEGKDKVEDLEKQKQFNDALGSIPVLGGLMSASSGIAGLINSGMKDKQTEEERQAVIDEYSFSAQEGTQAERQTKYASLFADGGYLDLFAESNPLKAYGGHVGTNGTEGVQVIEAGFPHEMDPMNGIDVGGGIAEVGETKVKLSGGDFVFSNRF